MGNIALRKKPYYVVFHKWRSVVNFINIKLWIFRTNVRFGTFYYVHVTRKKLLKWCSYEKRVHFTLMKLIPDIFMTLEFSIKLSHNLSPPPLKGSDIIYEQPLMYNDHKWRPSIRVISLGFFYKCTFCKISI